MRIVLRRTLPAAGIALLPGAALAHDAFGDLGPFYGGLLHPVMAPVQTLLLAAVAILLARQPLASVRVAYPAAVLAGASAIVLNGVLPQLAPSVRFGAIAAVATGGLALWGRPLPRSLLLAVVMAVTALAAFAGDPAVPTREGMLAALGAILGIGAFVLLLWGVADMAQSRLGRIAGAVAAAWLIAIGAMAAVLPG
ncbi:hypothetical protein [Alloyangia pacifica]|uniref:HupE / UreJ protein n=1 Tax=Alloyangia pacifica TaxID=311180 RepID=A0A1I6RD76_9RHOB|nr:hypothetical protein [Alloyangia pacifica]SDG47140.1 hypothetical protein SAMN04488245_1035 [Alloyangia pacifica]SFS62626.1 hypothetical protein SAMN04488050_1035 [Alloyangia pacifica]